MPQSAAKLAAKKAKKRGTKPLKNPHEVKVNVDDDFDFVDEDDIIQDQQFAVISFYEPPQDVLTLREVFIFQEFIKECLREDPELKKKRVNFKKVSTSALTQLYNDFRFDNIDELNKLAKLEFPDQIFERAVKLRGNFKSQRKAQERMNHLKRHDQTHSQFISEVGKWMPFNPPEHAIDDYQTSNKRLNEMMHAQRANNQEAKEFYEKEKQERIRQCMDLNSKRRNAIDANDEDAIIAEQRNLEMLGLLDDDITKSVRKARKKPSKAAAVAKNAIPEDIGISGTNVKTGKNGYSGIRVKQSDFEHSKLSDFSGNSELAQEYDTANMSTNVNEINRRKKGKDKMHIKNDDFDEADFDSTLADAIIKNIRK